MITNCECSQDGKTNCKFNGNSYKKVSENNGEMSIVEIDNDLDAHNVIRKCVSRMRLYISLGVLEEGLHCELDLTEKLKEMAVTLSDRAHILDCKGHMDIADRFRKDMLEVINVLKNYKSKNV